MKPALVFAAIAGGVSGTFTFQLLNTGLKAAASPGSIIAILLMTPKGNYLKILTGVLVAAIVSFVVAAIILKADKSMADEEDLEARQRQMNEMKAESKGTSLVNAQNATEQVKSLKMLKKLFLPVMLVWVPQQWEPHY